MGDCCVPSPKRDGLGIPSLVPPVEDQKEDRVIRGFIEGLADQASSCHPVKEGVAWLSGAWPAASGCQQ